MLMIECKSCSAKVFTEDGRDPDRLLACGCCPVDHHHGKAADETGTPCRPVTIMVLPGTASLSVM
jgi:hypothetical protein